VAQMIVGDDKARYALGKGQNRAGRDLRRECA
jgi:hypothetical protein